MDPEVSQQLSDLRREVTELKRTVSILTRIRVDEASGGGMLVVSSNDAVLRVNGLTLSGQQLP